MKPTTGLAVSVSFLAGLAVVGILSLGTAVQAVPGPAVFAGAPAVPVQHLPQTVNLVQSAPGTQQLYFHVNPSGKVARFLLAHPTTAARLSRFLQGTTAPLP